MKVCDSMVRRLVLVLGLATAVFGPSAPLLAGGSGVGHTHSKAPASKDEILDTAKKVRDKLIGEGKIEGSWKGIDPDGAEQKEFGKKKEWVVTFKDAKAADASKQTLYMFFSLPGNYLAVNYTGK